LTDIELGVIGPFRQRERTVPDATTRTHSGEVVTAQAVKTAENIKFVDGHRVAAGRRNISADDVHAENEVPDDRMIKLRVHARPDELAVASQTRVLGGGAAIQPLPRVK